MHKIILSLSVIAGLTILVGGASATPSQSVPQTAIQPIDWYCGPNCQQHRYWQRQSNWHHRPYYGYHGYPYRGYYGGGGYYGGYYR